MILNAKLRHFLYWLFQARSSGLKKDKFDYRDFKAEEHLGWGFYKAKHKRKVIPQLSVKNQAPYNTCVWNATTGQKEIDEKVILSPRSIVTRGKQLRLLAKDGFASLRSGQKVLSDWGIMQDNELPDQPHRSWNEYSSAKLDSKKASKHRIKSYFSVKTRTATLKAIDNGHVVVSGIKWYTGWNTRYLPKNALISGNVGYPVGGHAIKLIGYDMDYEGVPVYIFQNSYGGGYGVKLDEVPMGGVFYITMDYFDKVSYTGWVNIDMEKDVASFIKLYAQKNVRDPETGGIFLISAGKKRPYPDMFTYVCWNPNREAYTNLDEDEVDVLIDVLDGPIMKSEESPLYKKHKAQLKELVSPQNFEKLEELLHQK